MISKIRTKSPKADEKYSLLLLSSKIKIILIFKLFGDPRFSETFTFQAVFAYEEV